MTRATYRGWTRDRMSEARKTVLDNRYDVGRPLGSGGMGEVFLARDRVLGRDVALKVLRTQYAGDSEFAERFKREARSAASLSHPNIVQVYDRGETEEGAAYIAMEYVPGGTLKEKIVAEGPLGAKEAAVLGAQVAEALGAAHERGMVHRDIKPQNVLLTDKGDAKVADFGIARAGSSVTTSKSDLYSLGVVLYEALTGELPFTGDNPIAVSMKHVNEPLVPPGEIDPNIPAGMNALVTKLMAKDPEDRYASADELGDDLWKVSRGLPPTTAGEGRASHTQRTAVSPQALAGKAPPVRPAPVRRRRGIPWLPIVVAAMLLFLGTFVIIQKVMEPNSTNGWFDFLGGSENPPVRNSGPKMLQVPAVVGLTTAEARQNLTDAGLKVGLISRVSSDNVAAGRVIASGYSAGAPVKPGTAVNLDVSTGPATVSSPSPTASARSSPAPTATASPSASSAQPSQQQQRQAAQQPADTNTAPKTKAKTTPAPSSPSPTARAEDKGAKQGISVTNGNSGPGGNSGNSGNSGPGSGKGNN